MRDILDFLLQVARFRRAIQVEMVALPERFQRAAPICRMRLRPWRDARGFPFAIYWIIINRRRASRFRWQKDKPTFPFRRPKIRTRENLDDAIFFAHASKVRRVVYQFHALVKAVNSAHAELSRAIDSLRKRLRRFLCCATDLQSYGKDIARVAGFVGGLEIAFDESRISLQRLDFDMSILPSLPFRLFFEQDLEHPYGRLRWRRVSDGRPFPALTDKVKRALHVPAEISRLLTPHERKRRWSMRNHKRLTTLRRRILATFPPLLNRVKDGLRVHGIDLERHKGVA